MPNDTVFYQLENSAADAAIDRRHYTDFAFSRHVHAKPELIYVSEGTVEISVDGHSSIIPQGSFALVLPWQVHAYRSPAHSRCVVLVIASRYLEGFLKKMVGFCAHPQVFTAEEAIRQLFLSHLTEGPFPDEWLTAGILLSLCHSFVNQCPLQPRTDPQQTPLLLSAMNLIASSYTAPLTLSDVALKLGYSYHHLSHLFKEYTGMSFCQFVSTLRVTHAQGLLQQGDASVTEIAYECGFASVRNFNRVFLEITGLTPGAYRLQARPQVVKSPSAGRCP